MHIAVLGASGATGHQVALQALERGWTVTAVVRNPDSMKDIQHDNLKVAVGDIFDADSMAKAIESCEAVVSCLGPRGYSFLFPGSHVTIYSQSANSIVAGMRKLGMKRLVVLTGSCTEYTPENPFMFEWFLKPLLRALVADMLILEQYLSSDDCPDINYTVVKPNNLTNGAKTEGDLLAIEGQYAGGYFISRADVARFMLDCLVTDQWDRKKVAIAPS